MRIFSIQGSNISETDTLPEHLPDQGYLWLACSRQEFEHLQGRLQGALLAWTGLQLVDLHISDLLNKQLPSHYDYTS